MGNVGRRRPSLISRPIGYLIAPYSSLFFFSFLFCITQIPCRIIFVISHFTLSPDQNTMAQNMMPGLEQSLLRLQWSVNAIQMSLEGLQESQRNSQWNNDRHVNMLTQAVMDIQRRIAAPQQALPQPRQPRIPGANPVVQRRCASSSQTHMAAKTLRTNTTYACSRSQTHMWMAYE